MSNLTQHAEIELKRIGAFDKDGDFYGGMTGDAVMELIKVFSKQGHSGMSANLVRNLFNKVADYKPLSPITCDADEWSKDELDGHTFQNTRCSAVFKEGINSKPYYLDAIVWKNENGNTYTGSAYDKKGNRISSGQFVKLPFVPKTFYVDVIEKEIAPDDWEFYIKDEKQLDEVFKYYEKKIKE